jgi:hypothetical protein
MNHPGINAISTSKPVLDLLLQTPKLSIPSSAFQTKDILKNPALITDFLNQNPSKLYILKPSNSARSANVHLVKRAELFLQNDNLVQKLLAEDIWMLQPYRPSDLIKTESGELKSPVGRLFYHLIYDGKTAQIVPLTAWNKLNDFTYANEAEQFDKNRVAFGPSTTAAKLSAADLDLAINAGNRYLQLNIEKVFELSQIGLAPETTNGQQLIKTFMQLKDYEKAALTASVKKYHVVHQGAYEHYVGWRDFRKVYEIVPAKTLGFENPIYKLYIHNYTFFHMSKMLQSQ